MPEPIVVYPARIVRTVDPGRPTAQAIAVRGDRIRAVGSVEELMRYAGAQVDDRFADAVIVPGFVEAHSHTLGAAAWRSTYLGYFDRRDPTGRTVAGCPSIRAALDRLCDAEKAMTDPDSPLVGWGFDAIYYGDERLSAAHLDTVSRTRPILVRHASSHVATVNTAMIEQRGIHNATQVEGVVVDERGYPTGELQEMAAMALANMAALSQGDIGGTEAIALTASEAANVGCTTLVDLGNPRVTDFAFVRETVRAGDDPSFPVRLSIFHLAGLPAFAGPAAENEMELLADARAASTDRIRFGHVKMVLDGSIQQFTARLQAPGYFNRDGNGIWTTAPHLYRETFARFHEAGCLIHVHCNGDEASELFLDVLEDVLERHPRWDHRHTMTHSQLTTASQYKRLARLGGCANIFANHIFYWGDQHRDQILGPDRAARMDATATAIGAGVPITIHCDTPITPLDPLKTMHHAVNRLTATGKVLGEHERISADEALRAITLGGAFTLKMDHEVGSLEAGKFADFAVLDADPVAVAPTDIGSIGVLATVSGGRVRSDDERSDGSG